MFFDARDCLALVNPRMEEYFGLDKAESKNMIGSRISDIVRLPPMSPLGEIFTGSLEHVSRRELSLSEKAIFEVSVFEVVGRAGKIGTLLTVHDISREKMVEKMKRNLFPSRPINAHSDFGD